MQRPPGRIIELSGAGDGLLEEVIALERRCFPDQRTSSARDELLSGGHVAVLCAAAEGRVLGFASYRRLHDELHLIQIATLPEERRLGHARRLMEHLLAASARLGCAAVLLEVRSKNRAAIALYEQHGFRRIGLRRAYYPDGEDAVLMERTAERAIERGPDPG